MPEREDGSKSKERLVRSAPSPHTWMWQEAYGEKYYRFQTIDPAVAKRMRQRKKFERVGYGINTRVWIYRCDFCKPQNARRTLTNITRRKIKKDAANDTFYA